MFDMSFSAYSSDLLATTYDDAIFTSGSRIGLYNLSGSKKSFFDTFVLRIKNDLSNFQNECHFTARCLVNGLQDDFIVGVDVNAHEAITLKAIRQSHKDRFGEDWFEYEADVYERYLKCLLYMRDFGHIMVADALF
jgi:hypothetical protein